MRRACGAMLVAALLAAGARPAPAQTAQITGKITDPSGAVVPGAEISAVNLETGSRRETVSNSEGYYALPLLPPGTYDVRAHVAALHGPQNYAPGGEVTWGVERWEFR